MDTKISGIGIVGLVVLGLLGLAGIWYLALPDGKRRYINNILRQVPYLPARYMV